MYQVDIGSASYDTRKIGFNLFVFCLSYICLVELCISQSITEWFHSIAITYEKYMDYMNNVWPLWRLHLTYICDIIFKYLLN